MSEFEDLWYRFLIHDLCALPVPSAQSAAQRAAYIALRGRLWEWIQAGEEPWKRRLIAEDYELRCLRAARQRTDTR